MKFNLCIGESGLHYLRMLQLLSLGLCVFLVWYRGFTVDMEITNGVLQKYSISEKCIDMFLNSSAFSFKA